MRFRDKVVWVTGASAGIGEALTYEFSREGAKLILSSRNAVALAQVRDNCQNHKDDINLLPLDLGDLDSLQPKAQQALAAFGKIDILVNNGGIGQISLAYETNFSVDRTVMNVNFLGQVALTKAVLPSMIERQSGHIVVVSSVSGKIGVPMRSAYCASKHALHGFFDSLRAEVWRYHIRVTIVCPGFVRTHLRENALSADGTTLGKRARPPRSAMSADACAAQIINAIAKSKEEVYIGREGLAIYAYRFFPGLVAKFLRRVNNI